ncbi:MAG: hypothetical protein JW803_03015 [Endomicrobiales bacterium]|nr:hypothetical protein [Endomicrobiales bacterium]
MLSVKVAILIMLFSALVSVTAKKTLTVLVSFATTGMGFCLVLLLLKAPEVAIVLFTLEIVFLAALSKLTTIDEEVTFRNIRVYDFLFMVMFAVLFVVMIYMLSTKGDFRFGALEMKQAARQIDVIRSGLRLPNIVSAILYEIRYTEIIVVSTIILIITTAVYYFLGKKENE